LKDDNREEGIGERPLPSTNKMAADNVRKKNSRRLSNQELDVLGPQRTFDLLKQDKRGSTSTVPTKKN
jgi:hypothetical protein